MASTSKVTHEDVPAVVRKIIEEQLDVRSAVDTQRLGRDLGADSLDTVELALALESAFDIGICIEDQDAHIDQKNTVAQVIAYVISRVGA